MLNAAAHKYLPLMQEGNAREAIQNNARDTWHVAEAAIAYAVEKFVMVSTDKAVNPTNVMGASKRLAEMVCQRLQAENSTRFVIVRFGTVPGSDPRHEQRQAARTWRKTRPAGLSLSAQ